MDSNNSDVDYLDDFLKMKLMSRDTPYDIVDTSTVTILMNAMFDNHHVVKNAFLLYGTMPSYELLTSAMKT